MITFLDDKSAENAKNCGAEVVLEKKKGKGNVVKRMFSDPIDADIYVMVDGDDTYDTSKISDSIRLMTEGNFDMLVGYRKHSNPSAYRPGHVFGNKFFQVSFIRFLEMI